MSLSFPPNDMYFVTYIPLLGLSTNGTAATALPNIELEERQTSPLSLQRIQKLPLILIALANLYPQWRYSTSHIWMLHKPSTPSWFPFPPLMLFVSPLSSPSSFHIPDSAASSSIFFHRHMAQGPFCTLFRPVVHPQMRHYWSGLNRFMCAGLKVATVLSSVRLLLMFFPSCASRYFLSPVETLNLLRFKKRLISQGF